MKPLSIYETLHTQAGLKDPQQDRDCGVVCIADYSVSDEEGVRAVPVAVQRKGRDSHVEHAAIGPLEGEHSPGEDGNHQSAAAGQAATNGTKPDHHLPGARLLISLHMWGLCV